MYPLSIPIHGMALNITCTSYDGQMGFGLTGCRRTVPHLQRLLDPPRRRARRAGEGRRGGLMEWVCDTCGREGESPDDVVPDEVQCPVCGEPVTPLG